MGGVSQWRDYCINILYQSDISVILVVNNNLFSVFFTAKVSAIHTILVFMLSSHKLLLLSQYVCIGIYM